MSLFLKIKISKMYCANFLLVSREIKVAGPFSPALEIQICDSADDWEDKCITFSLCGK